MQLASQAAMPERCIHGVVPGSAADAPHLLRVDSQAVLAVLLEHGEGLLVGDFPHPVRVARHPLKRLEAVDQRCTQIHTNFGEGNQLAASSTSFIDEADGLLDTALEVEPGGLGGDLSDC